METTSTLDGVAIADGLPEVTAKPAVGLHTHRSKITNGRQLLSGIDGRSTAARRYRDLVQAYAEPLGGLMGLSAAQAALVREAASVSVQSESMASALARGEWVDPEQSVRVANTLSKLVNRLEKLSLQQRARAPRFSISDYLELRDRRAADVDEAAE